MNKLLGRIQEVERRAGACHKDPAEMTLAELCAAIVASLGGDRDKLQPLLAHLPGDVLQRQADALRHAEHTGSLALVNGAELTALLQACGGGEQP